MRIKLLIAVLLSMSAGVLASTGEASAQQWVPCGVENGVCRTPYPTTVRYGARGAFAVRQANGVIACNNRTFGDPLVGVLKGCAYLARQAAPVQQWVPCAAENGVCRSPYPTVVRYGARGAFAQRQSNGVIRCDNRTFGDPLYGVVKGCAYLSR